MGDSWVKKTKNENPAAKPAGLKGNLAGVLRTFNCLLVAWPQRVMGPQPGPLSPNLASVLASAQHTITANSRFRIF